MSPEGSPLPITPEDVKAVLPPVRPSPLPTNASYESAGDRLRVVARTLAEEARTVGLSEEARLKKLDVWKSRGTWAAGGVALALAAWGLWRWRKS